MKNSFKLVALLFIFTYTAQVNAQVFEVDCNTSPPGTLSATEASSSPGDIITISGTCHESLHISKDDLTLVGITGESKATLSGFFPEDRITVDAASRVTIVNLVLDKGILGLSVINGESISLIDVDMIDNVIGADIKNGSSVEMSGEVNISGSAAFGLEVLTGSELTLAEDTKLNIVGNFLGSQVSVNSTLFASTGSVITAKDNTTLGLSVNTGSTGMLFNSKLITSGNGLDGLDVVSGANFEVDGESVILSQNNGRDGISVDNSTLNMFGFFSTVADFPRIVSHMNAGNGILVEKDSRLDVGRNASIASHHNGAAGIHLDDGSSALIQRGVLHDNNGSLPRGKSDDDDGQQADIVVTFGSRVSFDQNANNVGDVVANNISLALCDKSSLSRGDVKCKD